MLCRVTSWSVMKSLKKSQKCKPYDISGDNCFHLHSYAINSYWFWDLQNSRVTGNNPMHSPMNYIVMCSLQFSHISITGYWLLIKVYLGVQNKCFPFYLNYGIDTDSNWFQTDDERPSMTWTVWHFYLWTTGITTFWSTSCNVYDTRLPWPVIILPDLNPLLFCTEIPQY
jgi:hypothetical protein